MKVQAKVFAYATDNWQIQAFKNENASAEERTGHLHICQNADMEEHGWTLLGEGLAELTIVDKKQFTERQLKALKAKLQGIRAEAQAKCTEIEGQINNLLAIEHTSDASDSTLV